MAQMLGSYPRVQAWEVEGKPGVVAVGSRCRGLEAGLEAARSDSKSHLAAGPGTTSGVEAGEGKMRGVRSQPAVGDGDAGRPRGEALSRSSSR